MVKSRLPCTWYLQLSRKSSVLQVVHHDGACWLAFMVALKGSPFALREQALKEVNMLLIENPGNCSNFKRQRCTILLSCWPINV